MQFGVFGLAKLSRVSGPVLPVFVISRIAARTFPSLIGLANFFKSFSSWSWSFCGDWCCFWIVIPSCRKLASYPSDQSFSRRSRCEACSLALDFELGFWSISAGMVIEAFSATHSSVEPSAYALNRQDSSRTKDFPAVPEGTLKRFLLDHT